MSRNINITTNITKKTIVIVGGGSAGHVLPALPVADELIKKDWQVHFVGTNSGLEKKLLGDRAITFHSVSAGKLRRYFSWQNFSDVMRILLGIVQAVFLLRKIRPSVIFYKCGFVSFPVVFAGWLLRMPIVAHESDLTPGLANRLVMPFVSTLCSSFAATRFVGFKGRVVNTGTPVREDLLNGDPDAGRRFLGVQDSRSILLVTGGSLGADALNTVVRDSLPELCASYFVVHICGPGKATNMVQPGYLELEYVDSGWGDILAAADIVVSRAGANALFELWALKKLTLLVPLSGAASRGDQLANAAYAKAQGLSEVVAEEHFGTQNLLSTLKTLRDSEAQYQQALSSVGALHASELLVAELEAVVV
jgi:UDP-N-acetylglucosamine--N-acetylmuramyl-(pentapeptide) pyrophosphoryl-undecaprenol N-acetylglucosamine transferase